MPDSSYYRDQAAIFDRVADACSMPELVPYYRQLAEDYRKRAAAMSHQSSLLNDKAAD